MILDRDAVLIDRGELVYHLLSHVDLILEPETEREVVRIIMEQDYVKLGDIKNEQ